MFELKQSLTWLISFNLNFVWSLRLEPSIASIELPLFILKITQDYIVILLKIIRRKQNSLIILSFTCKHKMDDSNVEVSTHYWIGWWNSKYVCFYVFMSNKFVNFLRNMLNSNTVKINNFNISTTQSNPMLNPSLNCFVRFILSVVDRLTIGTWNVASVILNFAEFLALDEMQSSIQFNSRWILQLINGISNGHQKLFGYLMEQLFLCYWQSYLY